MPRVQPVRQWTPPSGAQLRRLLCLRAHDGRPGTVAVPGRRPRPHGRGAGRFQIIILSPELRTTELRTERAAFAQDSVDNDLVARFQRSQGRWGGPPQVSQGLAVHGASPFAFDERRILAACVAPPSNTGIILSRRALSSRRLARLGATPDLHHGMRGSSPRDDGHDEAPGQQDEANDAQSDPVCPTHR